MADQSEENYAAAIGRSMWRLAKRRALSMVELRGGTAGATIAGVTQAAFSAAPENKGRPLAAPRRQAGRAPVEAPRNLREFLQRLGEELGSGDPPRGAT